MNWVHASELKSTSSNCSHEPFCIQPTSRPPPVSLVVSVCVSFWAV